MGLMRKLMMGCIPGVRTLVNTTEPHTSPELMNTPITLTVGASYSVSWTGDVRRRQAITSIRFGSTAAQAYFTTCVIYR